MPEVQVRFNQPVTAASVARVMSFDGAAVMVAPAYYDSNTPFWTPDGEARALWLLRPKAGLADDHDYALRIKPGLKSALGAQAGKSSEEHTSERQSLMRNTY